MKKAYSKPRIVFEDFTLNTHIASDCEVKTNTPSSGQCGVNFSGEQVFMEGMTGCEGFPIIGVGGDGQFANLCYHVPNGDNNLFNS